MNDWFDIDQDRRERPTRPIPSGAISPAASLTLGFVLMLSALAVSIATNPSAPYAAPLLLGAILLYDSLKSFSFAPVFMGACRALNIWLGVSAVSSPAPILDPPLLMILVGLYVAGVTIFARREAGTIDRRHLIVGILLMTVGIAGHLALQLREGSLGLGLVILAVLGIGLAIRWRSALLSPSPATVQSAVKWGVLGIVALEASTAALVSPLAAGILLAHLVPAVWLGRWLYST